MNLEFVLVIVAAVAAATSVGLIGLAGLTGSFRDLPRDGGRRFPWSRAGLLDGEPRRFDRAVLAAFIRRWLRRPEPPIEPTGAQLSASELAYRIGVADAPLPPRPDRHAHPAADSAGTLAAAAARANAAGSLAARSGPSVRPVAAQGPSAGSLAPDLSRSRRTTLVRDSAIAMLVLGIIGLAVTGLPARGPDPQPTDPRAAVLGATSSPAPTTSFVVSPPKPSAVVPTAAPTQAATAEPTAEPTAKPTPKPTRKPTAKPQKATPRPTPRPTPVPT
ncbi:MAG: hypothetical protein H0T59_07725, partial [Chloroflexi bacterium]|nr:hypothetical protein [Chloroflexota bacterium]